jgi:hypothetical protein
VVFLSLLSQINHKTPLGSLINIRSEENPETLKCFSKDQMRIRDEWRAKHNKAYTAKAFKAQYNDFKEALHSMM